MRRLFKRWWNRNKTEAPSTALVLVTWDAADDYAFLEHLFKEQRRRGE